MKQNPHSKSAPSQKTASKPQPQNTMKAGAARPKEKDDVRYAPESGTR